MKDEAVVRAQLDRAYVSLELIAEKSEPGGGRWRSRKSYIEALEWVLEEG